MDLLHFKNAYWSFYSQIESDFFLCEPYCAIDELNQNAFSVKYLQLYLSICGEIDSVGKSLCRQLSAEPIREHASITTLLSILNKYYPTFANETVILSGRKYPEIQPWMLQKSKSSPEWWAVYNKVKHHRDDEKDGMMNFKRANQKNIIEALAGLYILEEYWAAKNFALDEKEEQNNSMPQLESHKLVLKKWEFYKSFMGQSPWFDTKSFYRYIKCKDAE